MTNSEIQAVILNIISLVLVNFFIAKEKKRLYESKWLWVFFFFVKCTILLPALLMILQLYVFTFEIMAFQQVEMFHFILYVYIGYMIIAGFLFFMEEQQVNLLRLYSVILFAYQIWMSSILIQHKEQISYVMVEGMNPFIYGDTMGTLICCLGPILSFFAVLTAWHYWKGNDKSDFV